MSTTTKQDSTLLRLTFLSLIVIGLFVALFSRLWFLQVLAGDRYADLAERNRVRFVVLEAPRGRILDASGEELVKNRPARAVSAHPAELLNGLGEPRNEEAQAVLDRLEMLLEMSEEDIIARMLSRKFSPFRAVPIKEDVPAEVVFSINEHQELFTGIVAETLPVRTYPNGTLGAHVLGYLGEINEDELETPEYARYRAGDLIGWGGLEKTYETELRGEEGWRKLEVNAKGTVLNVLQEREPVRGSDLQTSLDVELQAAVEQILEEGIIASRSIQRQDGRFLPSVAGSAVVMDPRDGGIVAMASWPTFDQSEFVGGVSFDYWDWLNDPENEYPLLNRAIQSAYPPGSVFKIVSGAAALEADLISTNTRVSCPPAWKLSDITFRNWNPRHEGALDITDALKRSCDTFFYELAAQQWAREQQAGSQELAEQAELLPRISEAFGLGDPTGIDLPSERGGVIPGREWRRTYWETNKEVYCRKAEELPPSYARDINQDLCLYGGNWRGGDAVNSSIGQGDVLTTPLQIATSYAAVANGGTVFEPRVGEAIVGVDGEVIREIDPVVAGSLPITAEEIRALQIGLEKVVMDPRGTAVSAFRGFPLDLVPTAGKTGTAELKPKVPYAWFAAYAPIQDPRYVVVVSVEQGGGGSQTAAPIARRILEAAFDLPRTPFVAGERTD